MLKKENVKYIARLSPLQEGIFYHHLLNPASLSYFTQTSFHITGELDIPLFRQSFQQIVDRYDILRAVFIQKDVMPPRQIILKEREVDIELLDLTTSSGNIDRATTIQALLEKDKNNLFDPATGKLLRLSLAKLDENEYYLIWSHHHILMDGWCLSVIIQEFFNLYKGLTDLPAVIPYVNYIRWLENVDRHASLNYWQKYLSGYDTLATIPGALKNTDNSYQLSELIFQLNDTCSNGLIALSRKYNATLNTVIQCLWGILLGKYNNNTDVVFAAVVSGRPPEIEGIERMIGLFINTIPVRITTDNTTTFSELIRTTQQQAIESTQHHYVQLADVQNTSELGNGLMNHVMIFENYPTAEKAADGVSEDALKLEISTADNFEQSNYDFNITLYPGDVVSVKFSYNTNRYTNEIIQNIRAHFIHLAEEVVRTPDIRLKEISYLPLSERQQLLEVFSGINLTHLIDKSIVSMFESQVLLTPDLTAIIHGDTRMSYRELNESANQLANYLLQEHNAGVGDLIGLQIARSPEMVIGLLGILKTGAAYVPIDISYPEERISFMIADAGIRILLRDNVSGHENQSSYNPKLEIELSDTAYVIYTSGSTGQPKGVLVTHGNAAHFFDYVSHQYGSGPGTVFPFIASNSFDISLFQLLTPLLTGGTSVIIDREVLDDIALFTAALKEVTMIDTVPGVYNLLVNYIQEHNIDFSHIQRLFIGGDVIPDDLLVRLSGVFTGAAINITYGPTEGTIFCTDHTSTSTKGADLGRPISGSSIYIFDKDAALLPVGVIGEICIGGAGVSNGYHNQATLTAEKFIANPYKAGDRLYRTGDLGRWEPDGHLTFIGRADAQVKIRGFRIEPGEIERALLGHEQIREAIVLAKDDLQGGKYLVAYIVSEEELAASTVRSFLSATLPDYMIPSYFIRLEQLPLTSNGKIDRKALPEPGISDTYTPAGNETEERLVKIWEEVLSKTGIGIHDNFFETGGHSLKAIQLVSRIRKEFEITIALKDIFSYPDIAVQAEYIRLAAVATFTDIPKTNIQESYPLSHAQRRFWILSQFSDSSVAYNIPGVLLLEGTPDLTLLGKVLQYIVTRHESLRTVFRQNAEGEVHQYILPADAFNLVPDYLDVSTGPDPYIRLQSIYATEQLISFDLEQGPLLRTKLVKAAADQYALFYTMHHIISDGWSMEVLSKEVIGAYNAFKQGKEPEYAPLSIQYKDYAAWQTSQLEGDGLKQLEQYWLTQLEGELPVLDLPSDKIRPLVKTHRGASLTLPLSPATISALKTICTGEGATLFMGLLAGLKVLFYRYTGQEDIIVGSPIAGREHKELEGQIGLYINSLALRTKFSGSDNFRELLKKEKAVLLGAYSHQSYPFDMLIEKLQLDKDMSRLPLFDIMVGMQNQVSTNIYNRAIAFEDLKVIPADEMKQERSQFDLLFSFIESEEEIHLSLTYNTDIYSLLNIEDLCTHFGRLLQEITLSPGSPLNTINYLNDTEKQKLLQNFNHTVTTYNADYTLGEMFEQQAERTPSNKAVICEDKVLTYQQLNERANQLAHYLRRKYDIHPGDLVGIMADRSELMMIGLLAILKAGAAYVPVDPAYPGERIKYILTDANPKVVITISEYVFDIIDYYSGELFALDIQLDTLTEDVTNPSPIAGPADLAYVIYTSGSTGNPKGVMVPHHGVVNMSSDQVRKFDILQTDHVLLFASISFDASVSEMFMAFFTGATLVIIQQHTIGESSTFTKYLREKNITVVTLPPSYLKMLDIEELKGLRVLITAGQEADRELALRCSKFLNYYNAYGPTENSVCATICKVDSTLTGKIPIGKPIANTRLYILDHLQQLVPVGITGEICISGQGLAIGYLNNPVLSAEKFVQNPFDSAERMYRTGDLGRWLPDGNIEFLGRKDHQVKIRGYRIEPEEIEHVLLKYGNVKDAVVLAREDGHKDPYLAAYLVADDLLDPVVVRQYLAGILPEYMIPAAFVQLPALPLTPNGKTDRKALPDPAASETAGAAYEAPANELEQQLAGMWEEVLGKPRVGRNENFFTLGGHSLKAMQLLSRIRKELQVKIELNHLFTYATIAEQASYIYTAPGYTFTNIPVIPIEDSYPLSHAQQRFWLLSQFEQSSLAYNVPGACLLEGVLNKELFSRTVDFIVARHESLRTVFRENEEGEIRQYVLTNEEQLVKPVYSDVSKHEHPMESLRQIFIKEQLIPFDLSKGPLISIKLVKIKEEQYALFYTMHHIISDGWSMQVLLKEMTDVYNTFKTGTIPELDELRIQYKDYAAWQSAQLQGTALKAHQDYWFSRFAGELPVLALPAGKQRPPVKTHHGNTTEIMLPAIVVNALQQCCNEEGASLFMGLLAALKALFYLYSGQEDIIIGTPVAGREQSELENQIGLYLNTLALRTQFKGTDSFRTLLQIEKDVLLSAYTHQVYPFDMLVEQLQLTRDMSRAPLFDVLVIFQNQAGIEINKNDTDLDGLQIQTLEGTQRITSQFDIEISMAETVEGVHLLLNYNTDIYTRKNMDDLCAHFSSLLSCVTINPEESLNNIDYLSAAEKETLLITFNDTSGAYPSEDTIVSLFEKQAAAIPLNTAVVYENKRLTYEQLNEQANRLADHLRTTYNIIPGDLVGIMVERSELMMVALLAILKSGAAYVPVDPTYPPERITYILEDCQAKVLLAGKIPVGYAGEVLLVNNAVHYPGTGLYQPQVITPQDLCYVIYTSGSTGQPKGVMISHYNVLNFFAAMDQSLPVSADDCMLALTSTSFDISVLELLWTLCSGIEVVLHPSDISLSSLDRYIEGEESVMDFSLFFFSSYPGKSNTNKYNLLLEAARYADDHGFKAVWTPERHFHEFGGLYPNPSVVSAALAVTTKNISIRSGSVVAPLHDALRIAEEWSVVDNLSDGRVGMSFASGWNSNDFVLSQLDYHTRHTQMYEQIATVQQLWRGETVQRKNGFGQDVSLGIYPRPIQAELPVWITAASSEDTFISAGVMGANILTHMLGQDVEELSRKILLYRSSRAENGHAGEGIVTVMLHTYIGDDLATVESVVEQPFIDYLKSSVGLSKVMLEESGLKEEEIGEELKEKILKNSFKRYYSTGALIGTKSSCMLMVERLKSIGVNEIACLVDFGVEEQKVLDGLKHLNGLKDLFSGTAIHQHKPITMLQSTPSFLKLVEEDGRSERLLQSLRLLLVGGEAFPVSLLTQLHSRYSARIYNMYGPTETTIWSCVSELIEDKVSIGHPILNTQIYILNSGLQLVPIGVTGELYIGGEGVSRGYLNRPELTAERFIERAGVRLYKTGDLARWQEDGSIEFLGRKDQQVKIRGHRIELGEIETALISQEEISEALVTAMDSKELAAYLIASGTLDLTTVRSELAKRLPAYMIPAHYIVLTAFPLTPNGKIDKKALPDPLLSGINSNREYVPPANETEEKLLLIWEELLGRKGISVSDNFFELGGQSLNGMRMINMIRNEFKIRMGIVDLFNAQTIRELGEQINDISRFIELKIPVDNSIEKEEIIL